MDHFHSKWTASLAGTARNAIGRVRVERQVMLTDGSRHFAQVPGEIIILMHRGNINFLRAGQAVVAIHANSVGQVALRGVQNFGVILLLRGKRLVLERLVHMFAACAAN